MAGLCSSERRIPMVQRFFPGGRADGRWHHSIRLACKQSSSVRQRRSCSCNSGYSTRMWRWRCVRIPMMKIEWASALPGLERHMATVMTHRSMAVKLCRLAPISLGRPSAVRWSRFGGIWRCASSRRRCSITGPTSPPRSHAAIEHHVAPAVDHSHACFRIAPMWPVIHQPPSGLIHHNLIH